MTADPNCGVAHGAVAEAPTGRVLVAVFASPVAACLLRYGADLGFRTVLVEPDAERQPAAEGVVGSIAELDGDPELAAADVVVTDHPRSEPGPALRDALARPARWGGVL